MGCEAREAFPFATKDFANFIWGEGYFGSQLESKHVGRFKPPSDLEGTDCIKLGKAETRLDWQVKTSKSDDLEFFWADCRR